MRRLLIFSIFFSLSLAGMSQTKIQGLLKDSLTQETEPYATIRAFKSGNKEKPEAMALTSGEGKIDLDLKGKGEYTLYFSSVGKKEIIRTVTLNGQPSIDLGTIYTSAVTGELKGVEVIASKPIVKMETDRMTYNVNEDVDSKSMTVLDMLRKVPMVAVDAQDNITVNGSGSFKILVDGKPNVQLQNNAKVVFKMMPASAVEKIEVITNPGAKYDAEGVGGVLNLTLMHGESGGNSKEALNGYNGELSLKGGNRDLSSSIYVAGQQGKFSYNFNGRGGHGHLDNLQVENIQSQTTTAGTSTSSTDMSLNQKMNMAGASLSLGLELDSVSNINASFGYNNFNMKQESTPKSTFQGPIYGNGFSYTYDQLTKNKYTGYNASADYQRFFNKERTKNIVISYQFSTSPNYSRDWRYYNNITGSPVINYGDSYSDGQTRGTEHTIQIDYTTPIGKGQTINTGSKFVSHLNKSDSKFYNILDNVQTINSDNSILYENHQKILAGYIEHAATFGKWSTREGLRYEHTWENIDYPSNSIQNFKKNYGSLVPSATLSYTIAPMTNLGLSYNMRISRPGISYLNPYVNRSNPIALEYGNPNLDVEKSHNINLVFNTYTARFMANATLSQSFCNNQISQYSFSDANNKLNTTFGNNVKNRWTNLNTWMRYVAGKKTTIMFNGSVGYGDIRSAALNAHNHGWQTNGMVMLEQSLPWAVKMNLGVQASTKKYNIQGYDGGMSFSYIVLSKSFINERLMVSVFGLTPLADKLEINKYTHSSNFENTMNVSVPIRMFQVSVSWKFGNTKKTFKQHQSKINSDFEEHQSQDSQINNIGVGGMK